MPYQITWESRGVYGKFQGDLSSGEFFAAIQSIISDLRFPSAAYRLYDFSEVSGVQLSEDDIRTLSAMNYHSLMSRVQDHERRVTAFVVSHADTGRQLELFINAMQFPSRRKILADLQEARAWIAESLGQQAG